MLHLEEELVPVQTLAGKVSKKLLRTSLLLVVETGEQHLALAVDELIGQQQVLIQPLQGHLAELKHVSGCALLGEGEVGMVLDLNRIST